MTTFTSDQLTSLNLPFIYRVPFSRTTSSAFEGSRSLGRVPTQRHFRDLGIRAAVILVEERRLGVLPVHLDRELPAGAVVRMQGRIGQGKQCPRFHENRNLIQRDGDLQTLFPGMPVAGPE